MYFYFCLLSIFLGFLPLSFYLIVRNKLNQKISPLVPYLVLAFLASIYELVFTVCLKINASAWFKIYTSIEFFVLMHYFNNLLKGRYKYINYFFSILYLTCFGFIVFQGKINEFMYGDDYLQAIESTFVITAVILWMKYAFINLQEDSLLKFPHFYFISGLLFYFSGTLFLYLLGSLILQEGANDFADFWMLNLFFNIFLKILILIGIWKAQVK